MTDQPLKPIADVIFFLNQPATTIERGLVLQIYPWNQVLVVEDPKLYQQSLKSARENLTNAERNILVHIHSTGEFARDVGLATVNVEDITNRAALEQYKAITEQTAKAHPERR